MQPNTSEPRPSWLARMRSRWRLCRSSGSYWDLLPVLPLQNVFALLLLLVMVLIHFGLPLLTLLPLAAMAVVARCLSATWPEDLEHEARDLVFFSQEARQAGAYERALRLAQEAWLLSDGRSRLAALYQQAEALLCQERGAEALRALERCVYGHVPSPELRARAYLQVGEPHLALALARRMFARKPEPHAARLAAAALLQLHRRDEARQFLEQASGQPVSDDMLQELALAYPRASRQVPRQPDPFDWEAPSLGWLVPVWAGATAASAALAQLLLELLVPLSDLPARIYSWEFSRVLVMGTAAGAVLGLAQAWVLRRVLKPSLYWVILTAMGFGLGTVFARFMQLHPEMLMVSVPDMAVASAHKWILVSAFQSLVLSRWGRGTGAWVLAVVVLAPLVELLVLWFMGPTRLAPGLLPWGTLAPRLEGESLGALWLRALLPPLVLGAASGWALWRILAWREWAYQVPSHWFLSAELPTLSPRPKTAARTDEPVPEVLGITSLSGAFMCPRSDVFLKMPKEAYERISLALSFHFVFFIIVPERPQGAPSLREDPPRMGMLAIMYSAHFYNDGRPYDVIIRVLSRVRLHDVAWSEEEGLHARIEHFEGPRPRDEDAALARVRRAVNDYVRSTPELELEPELFTCRDPLFLAEFAAAHLNLPLEEQWSLLEDPDPDSRISRICVWLERAVQEPPRPPLSPRPRILPMVYFLDYL